MNEDTKQMLNEAIKTQFEDIARYISGSDEREKAVDEMIKLYKLKIEENKSKLEYEKFVTEKNKLKKQDKRERFKLGIEVMGLVLPLIFYAYWMKQGLKFEESGTFTSTTFRGLFQKFKPTIK